jgi:uncharacterized protein YcnI
VTSGREPTAGDERLCFAVTPQPVPRPTRRLARWAAGALVAAGAAVVPSALASAHTETDFVAVPAGATATVTFQPEHGCGESPTVDVKVQAPVAGAMAVELDGWTASATPDAEGNTVLEWSGGSLPADESGAFQVEFVVPDAVGTLLAFPAVQTCANGEQEAWIETEPGAESPAPQLLVLAAGSEPAATLEDVPVDAPGRDALAALDAGVAPPASSAPTTTATPTTIATPTTTPVTTAPATSTTSPSTTSTTAAATTTTSPTTTTVGDDSGSISTGWIVGIVIGVVIVGAVIAVLLSRRRGSSPPA